MEISFSMKEPRALTEANYISYEIPAQHPNRRMREHDFIYMLSGTWRIGQDGITYAVEKDDVLVLSAHHHHYGIEPCTAGTRTMYFHVNWAEGDQESGACGEEAISFPNHLCAAASPIVRQCFERMISAHSERDVQMAASYFDVLLYELHRLSADSDSGGLASSIKNLIIASPNRMLKNGEIAQHLNVSIRTAESAFKRAYGVTIHQYILQCQIERAESYLINHPRMTLFEVARDLGFYDEFHLSRQFRMLRGMSPSEFRKQKRREEGKM